MPDEQETGVRNAAPCNATIGLTPHVLAVEYLLLMALSLLWGGSYALMRLSVQTIPPLTVVAVRVLLAALVLLAIMWVQGLRFPRSAVAWRQFAFQAMVNSVLPWTLLVWALQFVDSGVAGILNSTAPLFVYLLTLQGEGRRPKQLTGAVLGFLGIVVIVGVDALSRVGMNTLAQLAVVASSVSFAIAAVFGRRFSHESPITPAAGSMLVASIVMVPLSLTLDAPWRLEPSVQSAAALVTLSVLGTAIAFAIYFRLLKTIGSLATSSVSYLRGAIAAMVGVALLAERLHWSDWIGLLCIVGGVALMVGTNHRVRAVKHRH